MTWCGYVEHRLDYFSFYVQKHIAHLAACSGPRASSRQAASGARISETRLLLRSFSIKIKYRYVLTREA